MNGTDDTPPSRDANETATGAVLDTVEKLSPGEKNVLHLGENPAGLEKYPCRIRSINPVQDGRLHAELEPEDDNRPEEMLSTRLAPQDEGGWSPESQFVEAGTGHMHVHVSMWNGRTDETIQRGEVLDIERRG